MTRMEIIERKEAKAAGLQHYFTGRPCKRGHVDRRITSKGICVACTRERSARPDQAEWKKQHYQRNRSVIRQRQAEYRTRNAESLKVARQAFCRANPEIVFQWKRSDRMRRRDKIRESKKRYVEKNRERVRAAKRAYYEANADRAREDSRRAYERNKAHLIRLAKEWQKRNPEKRARIQRANLARRRQAMATSAVPFTAADLDAIFKLQRGRCGYCRVKLGKSGWHADHIVALTRGGSNARSNIQVLCRTCNLSKGAKDP
ncbi:MAG: HNH endonuclease, partial [Candidatus Hydrogenedentes bacterium]|nr:HNH endonuclease [Candidatus Hydrogenedentota bacterium]